jgi:hypothetical protein
MEVTPAQRTEQLRAMLRKVYRHDQFAIHNKVLAFHDRLKARYPDYPEYELYHLISFSTLKAPLTKYDFPGEDSIETFIRTEYSRLYGDQEP